MARTRDHSRTIAALGALGALGIVAVALFTGRPAPPPPAPGAVPPAPLAGSQSCRSCHAVFFQKWSTSFHGLAMQPHTGDFARDRLTPQEKPIAIGGRSYRAVIGTGSDHVEETGPAGKKTHAIVQVLGGKNVCYFLTPLDRGLLQVLPVAYDMNRKEWFSTAGSAVRHFAGVTDEELDWTDRAYTFNTSCFSCHVSQLATNYEPATDSYRTVWAEPGVSCETCHGPAGEHVRAFEGLAPGVTPKDWKIVSVKTLSKEQRSDLCASCHAKASPLWTAFRPGDRFFDHFDLTTLESPDYHPDGRDLGENYTFTSWRQSPCVKSGRIDCVHCHTSSGRYKFEDRPNDACLPCHEERVRGRRRPQPPPRRRPGDALHRLPHADDGVRAHAAERPLDAPARARGDARARLAERVQRLPRGPRRGLGREDDSRVGRPWPVVGEDPARGAARGRRPQGRLVAPSRGAPLPGGGGTRRDRDRLARAAPRRVRGRLEVARTARSRRPSLAPRACRGGHGPRGRPGRAGPRPRRGAGRPAPRPRARRGRAGRGRPGDGAGAVPRSPRRGPGRARAVAPRAARRLRLAVQPRQPAPRARRPGGGRRPLPEGARAAAGPRGEPRQPVDGGGAPRPTRRGGGGAARGDPRAAPRGIGLFQPGPPARGEAEARRRRETPCAAPSISTPATPPPPTTWRCSGPRARGRPPRSPGGPPGSLPRTRATPSPRPSTWRRPATRAGAERALRALVARHPGYRDGWAFLGALLEGQGRSAEAADVYRRAAETAALPATDRAAFAARAQAGR